MKANIVCKVIEMTKAEAKAAGRTTSPEFAELNELRAAYPTFRIEVKASKSKGTMKGLTVPYMKKYIEAHDDAEKEFEDLLFIAECHSKSRRYPAIKRWFLARYPEVAEFGLLKVPMPAAEKPSMKVLNNNQELAPTGTEG